LYGEAVDQGINIRLGARYKKAGLEGGLHPQIPAVRVIVVFFRHSDHILLLKTIIMGKSVVLLFITAMLTASIAIAPEPTIYGHWVSAGPNGASVFLDFNTDGSFKVFTNAGVENEGRFRVVGDTFFMYDHNCGMQVPGRYLLTFYGEDSVVFTLANDPCKERAGEVNGGRMKRRTGR
jgi:hypothetical protein